MATLSYIAVLVQILPNQLSAGLNHPTIHCVRQHREVTALDVPPWTLDDGSDSWQRNFTKENSHYLVTPIRLLLDHDWCLANPLQKSSDIRTSNGRATLLLLSELTICRSRNPCYKHNPGVQLVLIPLHLYHDGYLLQRRVLWISYPYTNACWLWLGYRAGR